MAHISTRYHLVVIGNGMAGMRTVEELINRTSERLAVTVLGKEPHPNYNRIMLSSILAGEKEFEDIILNPQSWYEEHNVTLHTGDPVVSIDRTAKTVLSSMGRVVPYDKLLLATGSQPLMPPWPGITLPGVVAFRDIADVKVMLAAAKTGQQAVIIGGGLLGLEAAWGLKRRGMEVTVVHLMPTIMERQLDVEASNMLRRDLTGRGLHFLIQAETDAILGSTKVYGLRLADGREIPADLVVVAIGVRPNVTLAKNCGLAVNRGIVVGNNMLTSDPAIYAVGECIEHAGQVFGLVTPLWGQAEVCASHIAGDMQTAYVVPSVFSKLKITGIDVFSAGQLEIMDPMDAEVVFRDAMKSVYRKLIIRDNRLVGTVLYGDIDNSSWYFELIRTEANINSIRDRIIFGQTFAEGRSVGSDINAVVAMADSTHVCGCNGVTKGTIIAAVRVKGLRTLEDVRAYTKASASCGQCTNIVKAIITSITGETLDTSVTLCQCTDIGHTEVRQAIIVQCLKTQEAVRTTLGWKSGDGCAKCRPALNYYLICAWPGEYVDDSHSRFINERVHANIQKDGTYSVIPRIWGGITTPATLRVIADVAEKYAIHTVKITGGQRIDLLGVHKKQLPTVWADLNAVGLVSGHAYGKALRTVKTCVGTEWCRFGTQDSTALGVKLEKLLWGSWTPHKVKLAVSGCPRNCAEATIKDIGIVCIEAGYNIIIGGNGGIDVRVADHLVHVTTEAEVLEYCVAFLQLYREEAHYLERTALWVIRTGLPYIKMRLLEDEAGRKTLYARFLFSQIYMQDDPWAERASGAIDSHEFQPLVVE